MLKKGDFIVFGVIIALSLALIFALFGGSGKYITVRVDGDIFGKYSITADTQVEIKSSGGTNTLIIKNGKAHFANSDCPDKTCENSGEISHVGQTIVCLPHRVIAEVTE